MPHNWTTGFRLSMGLFRRIFRGGGRFSWGRDPERTLVDSPTASGGKQQRPYTPIDLTPWSATRLAAIFQEFGREGSPLQLAHARQARQCLSRFWLEAPVDQLAMLYASPVGQCYRLMLSTNLASLEPTVEEKLWREGLARKMTTCSRKPEIVNLLLALMPYCERGKLKLLNATETVPDWLINDYTALFEPGLNRLLQRRPTRLLGAAGSSSAPRPAAVAAPAPAQSAPQPRNLEPLTVPSMGQRRGGQALALLQDSEFIGRMTGLVNLYTIDPSDNDVKRELQLLRRELGQVWLELDPAQLQQAYQSPFGQLYRNFLGSGFSRETLPAEDQQLRQQYITAVADMARPGAINVLLAVMPFFSPGKIQFGGGEQFLPAWLMADVRAFNGGVSTPVAR